MPSVLSARYRLVVVFMLSAWALSTSATIFGPGHPVAVAVATIGWGCAGVKRLMAWWNGELAPRSLSGDPASWSTTAAVVFGSAPLMMMPAVNTMQPAGLIGSVGIPPWLWAAGAGLVMGNVLRPLLVRSPASVR